MQLHRAPVDTIFYISLVNQINSLPYQMFSRNNTLAGALTFAKYL